MTSLRRWVANAAAYAGVIECLFDGPHTVQEMYDATGLGYNTIRKLMVILKRRKRVYIAAWERDSTAAGRYTIPAYAFGDKPDARRPPRLTSTQRSAMRRERERIARFKFTPTEIPHEALQDQGT